MKHAYRKRWTGCITSVSQSGRCLNLLPALQVALAEHFDLLVQTVLTLLALTLTRTS